MYAFCKKIKISVRTCLKLQQALFKTQHDIRSCGFDRVLRYNYVVIAKAMADANADNERDELKKLQLL